MSLVLLNELPNCYLVCLSRTGFKNIFLKLKFENLVTQKMLAYFIARGFITEFWKNRVLYFVGVYYCDSNIIAGSYWAGWWFEPLWKIWKSIGMMNFPIYGKIKLMFQTTNQWGIAQLCQTHCTDPHEQLDWLTRAWLSTASAPFGAMDFQINCVKNPMFCKTTSLTKNPRIHHHLGLSIELRGIQKWLVYH